MESKQRTATQILAEIDLLVEDLNRISLRLAQQKMEKEAKSLVRAFITHGAQGTSEPWTLRKECLLEWLQDYGSCVTDEEAEVIRKLAQLSEDYYRQWSEERRRY